MDTSEPGLSGTVQVTGGSIPYWVTGEGHPLLLIHAGVADHRMWDAQVNEFANRYMVITYDTRGYGQFVTEDVEFSNRQDVYDLLMHLGVERTYILGVSRGGQIATDFALEHPEKVDALIAVGPGLSGFEGGPPTGAELALFNEGEAAWEAKDWERAADVDVRLWVDGPGQPEGRGDPLVREKVRQMCLENSLKHEQQGRPITLDPPAVGRLTEITVPTLVVIGDLDVSGVRAAANALAEGIAGAVKAEMVGVAHLPPMEQPEEFNRLVLDFLEALEQEVPAGGG